MIFYKQKFLYLIFNRRTKSRRIVTQKPENQIEPKPIIQVPAPLELNWNLGVPAGRILVRFLSYPEAKPRKY